MKLLRGLSVAAMVAAMAVIFTTSVKAADVVKPIGYQGFISLRAPLWDSTTGVIHNSGLPEVAGELRFTNVAPRLTPWLAGEYTIGQPKGYLLENKVKGGFDYKLSKTWAFFSYYDYRPIQDRSRVFVGIKTNFRGSF